MAKSWNAPSIYTTLAVIWIQTHAHLTTESIWAHWVKMTSNSFHKIIHLLLSDYTSQGSPIILITIYMFVIVDSTQRRIANPCLEHLEHWIWVWCFVTSTWTCVWNPNARCKWVVQWFKMLGMGSASHLSRMSQLFTIPFVPHAYVWVDATVHINWTYRQLSCICHVKSSPINVCAVFLY